FGGHVGRHAPGSNRSRPGRERRQAMGTATACSFRRNRGVRRRRLRSAPGNRGGSRAASAGARTLLSGANHRNALFRRNDGGGGGGGSGSIFRGRSARYSAGTR